MNWVIIVLILLSIVGSMLWIMPSPRQRYQAQIRQKAMTAGLKVQMVKLKCPRATGEAEAEDRECLAYRLPRSNMKKSESEQLIPWQVFKLTALANDGLPEGWCWGKGERQMNAHLPLINQLIAALPDDTLAIESSAGAVSMYWYENAPLESVDTIKSELGKVIEAKI